MKIPSVLNAHATRAQIDRPVATAKVIRKLTGSSGKKKPSGADNEPAPAPAPAPTRDTLTRTNGIDAAKVAAGVPADH
ncbi:MAG: hypothetical protein ACTH1D_14995 [Mycobacteriaceae bacterium]|uniref:hypothetical protein n=1 Tax=Corynebacterium sp. TaxID=1720 RepID=UPI003F95C947